MHWRACSAEARRAARSAGRDREPVGAGTVIGAASVATAAPDGYTIMLGTSTAFAITVTLNRSSLRSGRDFAPVALTSNAPFLLLIHPSLPCTRSANLVKLAKEKPGELSYGSAVPARRSI